MMSPLPISGRSEQSSKPAHLAGGNPQIAKAEGDAPVQAYIALQPCPAGKATSGAGSTG